MGGTVLRCCPIYIFPVEIFFFPVAPSSFKFQPRSVTAPGAGKGGYRSEPKIHREEGEDTSFRMEGGIKPSENRESEERD